jgi:hypothetical protein
VAAPATGAWATREDQVAEWSGSAWQYTEPENASVLFSIGQPGILYYYDGVFPGGSWQSYPLTSGGGSVQPGTTPWSALAWDNVASEWVEVLNVSLAPTIDATLQTGDSYLSFDDFASFVLAGAVYDHAVGVFADTVGGEIFTGARADFGSQSAISGIDLLTFGQLAAYQAVTDGSAASFHAHFLDGTYLHQSDAGISGSRLTIQYDGNQGSVSFGDAYIEGGTVFGDYTSLNLLCSNLGTDPDLKTRTVYLYNDVTTDLEDTANGYLLMHKIQEAAGIVSLLSWDGFSIIQHNIDGTLSIESQPDGLASNVRLLIDNSISPIGDGVIQMTDANSFGLSIKQPSAFDSAFIRFTEAASPDLVHELSFLNVNPILGQLQIGNQDNANSSYANLTFFTTGEVNIDVSDGTDIASIALEALLLNITVPEVSLSNTIQIGDIDGAVTPADGMIKYDPAIGFLGLESGIWTPLGGGPNAELTIQGNATATTVAAVNTFYAVAGVYLLTAGEVGFAQTGTTTELTYNGTDQVRMEAEINGTIQSTNGDVIAVAIFVNNVQSGASIELIINGTGDPHAVSLGSFLTLSNGDQIDIRVENQTAANDITLRNLSFRIKPI